MNIEIEASKDKVIIEGVTINRPSRLSVSQWEDIWSVTLFASLVVDAQDRMEILYKLERKYYK